MASDLTSAVFSPCRTWRYTLDRQIATNPRRLVVVMLNPSTADETKDDQTIRRVKGFARAWGYGAVRILNLFALRSKDPNALRSHADPVGPDNDRHLRDNLAPGETVLAAWGKHGSFMSRAFRVLHMVDGVRWVCLGTNADGSPKHPLYVSAVTKPQELTNG